MAELHEIKAEFGISRSQLIAGLIGGIAGTFLATPILWVSGHFPWVFCWLTYPAMVLVFVIAFVTRIDVFSNAANPWANAIIWSSSIGLMAGGYTLFVSMFRDRKKAS